MYSEGRLTRSRARSQGVDKLEELSLTAAKVRTTSRKLPGRAAFLDVTNEVDKTSQSKETASSVKDLSAQFEPAKVQSETPFAIEPVEIQDQSLATTSLDAENPPAPLTSQSQAHTVEAEATSASLQADKGEPDINDDTNDAPALGTAGPDLQKPISLLDMSSYQDFAATLSTPQADHIVVKEKTQEQPSPHGNQVQDPLLVSASAIIGQDIGMMSHQHTMDNDLLGSRAGSPRTEKKENVRLVEDLECIAASPYTGMLSLSKAASQATPDTSLTPQAVSAVMSSPTAEDSASPEMPATVEAKQPDTGHIIADSSIHQFAQSTPLAAGKTSPAVMQTLPHHDMPRSDSPAGLGVLNAAYYCELDTDLGSPAVYGSAVLSDAKGKAGADATDFATFTEDGSPLVDYAESESDTDSLVMQLSDAKDSEMSMEHTSGGVAASRDPALYEAGPQTSSTPAPPAATLTGGEPNNMFECMDTITSEALAESTEMSESKVQSLTGSLALKGSGVSIDSDNNGRPESVTGTIAADDRWEMDSGTHSEPEITSTAYVPDSRLKSKIHASPSYDPRSLRQLRKEVAAKLAQTAAAKVQAFTVPAAPPSVPAGLYESQSDTDMSPGPCSQAHKEYTEEDDDLCHAIGSLKIQSASQAREPLRGLPMPQGMHIRFDDDGHARSSPSAGQTKLRGVPAPCSSHIRFD